MLLLRLFLAVITTSVAAGVAPGDEEALCPRLREIGTVPIPDYEPSTRILMDSWNYQNLLGTTNRTSGVVWQQVDNDENNPTDTTTNVSKILFDDVHFDD